MHSRLRFIMCRGPSLVWTLAIYTRYPVPGKSKTRLIPALGSERAAQLHHALATHTLETARAFRATTPSVSLEVHHTCPDNAPDNAPNNATMAEWLGPDLAYFRQCDGDLGVRMRHTFAETAQRRSSKTVIIGTDAPSLRVDDLRTAFALLDSCQVVLGPALDGGYYLIGLNRPTVGIFSDISWGSHHVLRQTEARLLSEGCTYARMRCQFDIDRPVDLARLRAYPLLAAIAARRPSQ